MPEKKCDTLLVMRNLILLLSSVVLITISVIFWSGCSSEEKHESTTPRPPSGGRFSEAVSTAAVSANRFYRGNVHTHTSKSDGAESPKTVVSWYKKHGYDFLFITDHDKLITYKNLDGADFITINGVELTGLAEKNKIPVHTNALCGTQTLVGVRSKAHSVSDVMQTQVDMAKGDGAITIFNHPNFGVETNNAMTTNDVLNVDGFDLLEIASGHPRVHPEGNSTHDSTEEIWDTYLTKKHRVFGVGVDDSHFKENADPGKAWLQVWAPALSEGAICDAIRAGHFYFSNGAQLNSISIEGNTFEVSVDKMRGSDSVEFIGANGRVLAKVNSNPARYTITGGELYVRARVKVGSKKAWTQPYYVQ